MIEIEGTCIYVQAQVSSLPAFHGDGIYLSMV